MVDQTERLTRAEMRIEQHDRLHDEAQASIRVLSDGINQLVQAEVRREQDDATFQRLFAEIDLLRKGFQDYKETQAEKELAAYRGLVWKTLSLAAVVSASLLVGHFGGKMLGG